MQTCWGMAVKAKNVKVGVGVVIKDCAVGYARRDIGKCGVIDEVVSDITCHVDIGGKSVLVYHTEIRKMKSSDLDEAPIVYTHPMQEHLGKEAYVSGISNRGFVVSSSNIQTDNDLLVDFVIGFGGHCGGGAAHPQKNRTSSWVNLEDITFLTGDDE